jgi:methyltransferase family protein
VEFRVARHPDIHVVLIEGNFPDCSSKIGEVLDWVYLDSNHQYDNVLCQLYVASKMTKPDGVIMGDDWWPDRKHPHHGVFRAVNQFN